MNNLEGVRILDLGVSEKFRTKKIATSCTIQLAGFSFISILKQLNPANFLLHTKSLLPFFLFLTLPLRAQFPPPAGQPGSTAIHKDAPNFINWANEVHYFQRGASDIANGWSVTASYGDSTNALGVAEGNSFDIVSLGDSGVIVLTFPYPIKNEVGFDFAVFENSFSHDYLEFAFVEVSTDGIRYVRFPCTSLIPFTSQTGTYANSNTELVDNLAGKYIQGYGTPFDLELLVDSTGINLDSINYVKIVDVIGTINPTYASYDSQGNIINDPYPSDFESGGFDLDAVGVIHENNILATVQVEPENQIKLYPNPASNFLIIEGLPENSEIQIFDLTGKIVFSSFSESTQTKIEFELPSGFYILKCEEVSIQLQIIN